MKRKTMLLALAMCVAGATTSFAADPQMGTWKLNEAKSKFSAGATKNSTVVYEAAGDKVKVVVDGVDGTGQKIHSEWTGKFDGKDYPVTGDATGDMRAYKKLNDRTMTFNQKKGGKIILSGRIVVSADGKSRTTTLNGSDAKGKKYKNTAVYDKE